MLYLLSSLPIRSFPDTSVPSKHFARSIALAEPPENCFNLDPHGAFEYMDDRCEPKNHDFSVDSDWRR
jgi:hypothetical protein